MPEHANSADLSSAVISIAKLPHLRRLLNRLFEPASCIAKRQRRRRYSVKEAASMAPTKDHRILKSKSKEFGGPTIKVIVNYEDEQDGQTEKTDSFTQLEQHAKAEPRQFYVPRDLLRASSKFFQAATKCEWDASRDDKHTISIVSDGDAFNSYVHWLYLGTIPRVAEDDVPLGFDTPFLATLYVLGEQLKDAVFKNAVLETIVHMALTNLVIPSGEAVRVIYRGTSEGSPARRLIADFCSYMATDWWCEDIDEYLEEALRDALKATVLLRHADFSDALFRDLDKYYEKV
ncbi:hypothetical protein BU23DRAFT_132900 [Bimuria novae-zelandiae CBS 107.79]|uniref:BTB domain-containing protein n=1 Tax=Bimuria novae-zelandiae CBS 107.79 TaxID=1447943 RepID=A0A6A5VEW2_9PLEO|nr:hypothetical protein BU23DRAFT_132900 [Bimuria novae-zelandiae CBS 107.79]